MTSSNGSVRAAIIGAGHFAYRMHIPVLAAREEVVLDSVCRLGREELDLIRDEFGFAFATEDWREVLDRDIDIAVISSPHNLHYEQAKAFLLQRARQRRLFDQEIVLKLPTVVKHLEKASELLEQLEPLEPSC